MDMNTQTPQPGSGSARGLGTAGLIIGIVALLFSFIPCVGMWAVLPGVVGIVLSAVGINLASKAGIPKGIALAGLICAIIAVLIAVYWIYITYMVVHNSESLMQITNELNQNGIMDSLNKAMEEMNNLTDSLDQN